MLIITQKSQFKNALHRSRCKLALLASEPPRALFDYLKRTERPYTLSCLVNANKRIRHHSFKVRSVLCTVVTGSTFYLSTFGTRPCSAIMDWLEPNITYSNFGRCICNTIHILLKCTSFCTYFSCNIKRMTRKCYYQ